ncbi:MULTISPECIES: I78 family peptidase inhibitor [Pseudomonas]|uniref:I78 family peptidase inhibitor n=1 Tax=Pseudomonas TaxID=286 RepID=UPI00301B8629
MTNEEVLQALSHLIGSRYAPSIKDEISAITLRPRVVGPGEMSTREFDPMRIHIQADANGIIEGFAFN